MDSNYGMNETPTYPQVPDPRTKPTRKNMQSPDWQQINNGIDEHLRFRASDHYNIRQQVPNHRHGTQGDNFDGLPTSAI